MDCQQIDKYVYEYCDDLLSPALRPGFQAHLDTCESCREKVASVSLEGKMLRSLPIEPALGEDFTKSVMTRVKAGHDAGRRGGWLTSRYRPAGLSVNRWWLGLTSAAVIVVALLLSPVFHWGVGRQQVADQSPPASVGSNGITDNAASVADAGSVATLNAVSPPGNAVRQQTDNSKKADIPVKIAARDLQAEPAAITSKDPGTVQNTAMQAYTSSMSDANSTRGNELWSLHPSNLPQEYNLTRIVSTNDDEMTYIYENKAAGNELRLVIAPEAVTLPISEETSRAGIGGVATLMAAPPALEKGIVLDAVSEPEEDALPSLSNSFQTTMKGKNQPFRVMIYGDLSTEELARLAAMIKLEGNE